MSTEEQVAKINALSHLEMAELWRTAPAGHPYFVNNTLLCDLFFARWNEFGGWTPELSKQVGWNQ